MAVMVRFYEDCSLKRSWSPGGPCLADRGGRIGSGSGSARRARRPPAYAATHHLSPCAKGADRMVFPGALKPRGGLTGFTFRCALNPKSQLVRVRVVRGVDASCSAIFRSP